MELKSITYVSIYEIFNEGIFDEDEQEDLLDLLNDDFSYGDDTLSFIRLEWLYDYGDDYKNKLESLNLPNGTYIKL